MTSKTFDLGIGLCLICMICLGMIGNIISFLVWKIGRRCKNLPGGLYLRALAVADSMVLCISATDRASGFLTEVRPRNLNIVFCKVETTLFHFGLILSSWIVVCFTTERTIAVCKIKRSKKWMGKTTTVSIIIFLTTISFLVNLPYTIGCKLLFMPDGKYYHVTVVTSNVDVVHPLNHTNETNISEKFEYCGADPSSFIYQHEKSYHFWFLDFVLIFAVPSAIITVCNIIVLCKIAFHRKKLSKDPRWNGVTARALAVSLVHVISSAPFSIAVLVPGFVENAFVRETGYYYYVGMLASFCTYLNHGCNFVLYSFFGTDFRRDTVDLLGRKPSGVLPETIELNSGTGRYANKSETVI